MKLTEIIPIFQQALTDHGDIVVKVDGHTVQSVDICPSINIFPACVEISAWDE